MRRDLRMAKGRSRTKISEVYIRSDSRNRSDHRCAYPKAAHSCKKDCKRGLARVFRTRCLRYL